MCAVALYASGAWAQAPARADARIHGEDFVYARYTTTGAAALYAGTRVFRGMFMAGVTGNTRNNARTAIAGAGTRLRVARGAGVSLFVAGARAPDDFQARLYAMPRYTKRPFSIGATAVFTEPLGAQSRRQLVINPATVALRLAPPVQIGLAAVREWTRGRPGRVGFGTMGQVRMPIGTLSCERMAFRESSGPEMRFTFSASR